MKREEKTFNLGRYSSGEGGVSEKSRRKLPSNADKKRRILVTSSIVTAVGACACRCGRSGRISLRGARCIGGLLGGRFSSCNGSGGRRGACSGSGLLGNETTYMPRRWHDEQVTRTSQEPLRRARIRILSDVWSASHAGHACSSNRSRIIRSCVCTLSP